MLTKTAYAAGAKLTGAMANNGAVSKMLVSNGESYAVPKGYHDGAGAVVADITALVAENIKQGATVGGVDGNFTNDANAAASHILKNKTAYVKGAKLTGSMANNAATNKTLVSNNEAYTIPKGYHDGTEIVDADITGLATVNIKHGATVGGVAGSFSGDADAAAADIMKDKKAYVKGALVTGSLVGQGAVSQTLTKNKEAYTVPAGFHDGGGKVTADITNLTAANVKQGVSVGGVAGNFTNDATAVAGDILKDKIAYSKGSKITGTMANIGAVAQTLISNGESYAVPKGYHDGTGAVQAAITDLVAENVKQGATVGGVEGTFSGDANAAASNILKDKTAYVKGAKLTGSMTNRGAVTKTLVSNKEEYTIASGYHNGSGKVTADIADLVATNIRHGIAVGGVEGSFTGDATAIAADLLSGKTAYAAGEKLTGAMPNNGAVVKTLVSNGESYTIPAGYHDGGGAVSSGITNLTAANVKQGATVGGVAGTFSGDATAAAADILKDKIAYASGTKLTGTMPSNGAVSSTLATNGASYTVPAGYHNGSGKVTASITDLVAANVKQGATVGGVAGNFTNDATAVAGDVLKDKIAYSKGSKLTGTMANNGAVTQTLASNNAAYTIPAGYHNGSGKVTAIITNLSAGNIKQGVSVGGVAGTFTSDATATAANILKSKIAYGASGAKLTGTMEDRGAPTWNPQAADRTISAGYYSGGTIKGTKGDGYYKVKTGTYKLPVDTWDNSTRIIDVMTGLNVASGAQLGLVRIQFPRIWKPANSSVNVGYYPVYPGNNIINDMPLLILDTIYNNQCYGTSLYCYQIPTGNIYTDNVSISVSLSGTQIKLTITLPTLTGTGDLNKTTEHYIEWIEI